MTFFIADTIKMKKGGGIDMGTCRTGLVDKLAADNTLPGNEMAELLRYRNMETTEYIFQKALETKQKYYGNNIFIRGTIEISNYCRNNCYYCGLRRDNRFITRFRLDENDIMKFCSEGYNKGIRTFVLMGGDDYYFTGNRIAQIISMIKSVYPECAVELCLGERQPSIYRQWYEAGASRYILWHETANDAHFKKVHPPEMSLLKRKQSLWELKEMGYQTGSGFMTGTPFQGVADVVEDLLFLKALDPQIVHITPFLPVSHTRFEKERSGNGDMTLYLMAIVRLMLPSVLLTADPALENALADGRKKSFAAGVNEVFASLATDEVKGYFNVYNKRYTIKNCNGDDVLRMAGKIEESGNIAAVSKGDYIPLPKKEKIYGQFHRIM